MIVVFLLLAGRVSALDTQALPTGFDLSPSFIAKSKQIALNPHLEAYPDYIAGQAVSIKISTDKSKVAVLTSGYNLLYDAQGDFDKNNSTEYLFIYDIRSGTPSQQQVIQIPNTFYGLAWHPKEDAFFVSGGKDDVVYRYDATKNGYQLSATIALNHQKVIHNVEPMVAELSLSSDGTLLAVANMENDSVSLIDVKRNSIIDELDLRPQGRDLEHSGGTYPFGIAITKEKNIYVTSMRDNELIKLELTKNRLKIQKRIKVGSQPTRLMYTENTNELFICESRSDRIRVLSTKDDTLKASFQTLAPKGYFKNQKELKGANPNALTLCADGKKLYVSNGGTNSIACFSLTRKDDRLEVHFDTLVPTLWYPNDVLVHQGSLFVVNGKSLSGANVKGCRKSIGTDRDADKACKASNQYVWQTKNASLEVIKIPEKTDYEPYTLRVLNNNQMDVKKEKKPQDEVMRFLHEKIKHIIYVVKENRTYDQVLGDLELGDSDSSLTLFPESIAPNHYALARNFVILDNFMASGSCSGDGWAWSTAARTTEYVEKMMPVLYARRGTSYDVEGHNRNIPVGLDSLELRDENSPQTKGVNMGLSGTADVAAPDGPDEEVGSGYLWNGALRKGLSIRNYGFFCNNSRYFLDSKDPNYLIPHENSYALGYRQSYPNKKELLDVSDPYFRGFDMRYPDLWRLKEWQREYQIFAKQKQMPNLMTVRLPHDHFGGFKDALAKVDTPSKQMADNDYALGLLIETVASGPYKDSTLIFITEDDAQNGADHVSAQRTLGYVVGPYIKHHAVVSEHYTTVHMLKTMESILGLEPLNINDGSVKAMDAIFDIKQKEWDYVSKVPDILYATDLDLPRKDGNISVAQGHDREYWQKALGEQNFQSEDKLDTQAFNKALWEGLKDKALSK